MSAKSLYRVEVRPRAGAPDSRGAAAVVEARSAGAPVVPEKIETAAVYLLQGELDESQVMTIAKELLCDPVTEDASLGAGPPLADSLIEVHSLPGVMDPAAEAIEQAIHTMLGADVEVRTGRRYDVHGVDAANARTIAERCLANTVVHGIYDAPYQPDSFLRGEPRDMTVPEVPIRELDDDALNRLSRDGHLFLSLEEMQAIQSEYCKLDREPTEIELETLAQTWSEHCVHKTLKATIHYREDSQAGAGRPIAMAGRPGHELHDDGSVTIHNLLKSTVVAATNELIEDGIDWCLSIFVDNAGVIAFDDEHAVCFKCETHNHPSAIEPYGGAATGIGGCIRDIIGTGLAARPIAATDIFCVAHPDRWVRENDRTSSDEAQVLPAGCLHPKRILRQIVAGVRDYGNRMGIPTLNGAVWFDDDYVGNPLVYCGCIGVMPRDKVTGDPQPGDRIIALGGRTGRDGIHGATFSSAELTDTHADEFGHAVQIGNPVTEKKMLDAILVARDHESGCLFSAITDCGAGGFSSAVGEMGEVLGADVELENAPLKYAGLSPTEIWISEAQERMVLAVHEGNVPALREICDLHDVEMCDLGRFGTLDRQLILNYAGNEVGRMSMSLLHDGLPGATRTAVWGGLAATVRERLAPTNTIAPPLDEALLTLLAHPNIASKHWIIRQYDHEVQGRSVVRPMAGVNEGPSDAAVVTPVAGSTRGLAIGNGLATGLRADPYTMTLAAIDECVRNLVCVGADPTRIAILDNFCWPSCNDPRNLGGLVRAAEACYDGAKAYRTPFISGKDSLNNQFTTEDGETIQIPATLLISGFGIVPDVRTCVTMDAKSAGNALVYVGPKMQGSMGGSHFAMCFESDGALPIADLECGPAVARSVHDLIRRGLVESAHDVSDGGLLAAAAEMAIAGELGLTLSAEQLSCSFDAAAEPHRCWFGEEPSRYLLEVSQAHVPEVRASIAAACVIGEFNDSGRLRVDAESIDVPIEDLRAAWRGALDW